MNSENLSAETVVETQPQEKELESPAKGPVMKAVLIKRGEFALSNSMVLPSFGVCLLGEEGTILVPGPNVLPILGVGNKDIKCSKCGYVLAMKIKREQVQNLTIKCPSCSCLNNL